MRRVIGGLFVLAAVCFAVPTAWGGDGFRLLAMDGHDVKWGRPAPGTGASLSYAVVTGPTNASGITNCRAMAPISGLLRHSRLTAKAFRTELAAALQMWEAAANIRFVRAKNAASADVLIGAEGEPDGVAFADVTPQSSGGLPFDRIARGMVCLNPEQHWTAAAARHKAYRLRYVLAHEIGHVLGLDHPGPAGELMSFEYSTELSGLQPGDIAGIITLYGPPKPAPQIALNAVAR